MLGRSTVSNNYLGLTADTLSQFIGVTCAGLLGQDILGQFDHIIDIVGGTLTISTAELTHSGKAVRLDEFMSVPVVNVSIEDTDYRMFFDTGAQISYFEDESIMSYPSAGGITDFYPGIGQFHTETYTVAAILGGENFALRCGRLPALFAMTLTMASVQGIVGNSIFEGRIVGYFPRRQMLVL